MSNKNYTDRIFTGHKLLCVVDKHDLVDPSKVARHSISYRAKDGKYYYKGYMRLLPFVEENLRPRRFAIAVSPIYYWIIFPNHTLKYHKNNNVGLRDAKIYGRALGVDQKKMKQALDSIEKYRKLVF